MPPKKKGKKGKKGKKDGEEGGPPGGDKPGSGKELNELSREFFLIQIKDLEQRLVRYQKKCDELGVSTKEYEDKYGQLQQDRKEIVDFLKKSLENRQDEISDLHDRLLGLQQSKDSEKESFDNQMTQIKREFQEVRDQLTSENMILGGKLSSLEEFKVQKDDLMKKFADMEEKLSEQEKLHTETIYNLERKAVVDKDRLKKEMVLRVNTVAAEFRKVSNKQMADTTKRNIRENVSINAQLAKMSEKTKEMIQENDELRERDKKMKLQIELLEASQEELAKKNHSNLKVLKMITSRARQQEVLLEELEAREQEYVQLDEEATMVRTENEECKEQMASLEAELSTANKALEAAHAENEDLTAAKERLEDVIAAAAMTLKEVISTQPLEDEEEGLAKRRTMIERLLLVLDSAAVIGKAPPPASFFQQRPKALLAPLTTNKKPGGQRGESSKESSKFPHYNLGDLGLIPRPNKYVGKAAGFASKVAHLSSTTRLGVENTPGFKLLTPRTLLQHDKLPGISNKSG